MHIQDNEEIKSVPPSTQTSEATGTNGEAAAPKKKKKKKKKPAAERPEEETKENNGNCTHTSRTRPILWLFSIASL